MSELLLENHSCGSIDVFFILILNKHVHTLSVSLPRDFLSDFDSDVLDKSSPIFVQIREDCTSLKASSIACSQGSKPKSFLELFFLQKIDLLK